MPASASRSSVSRSTAVSGSHIPSGLAAEAVLEVGEPPEDLGPLVAPVGERQDDVVVALRQRRAVPGEALAALRASASRMAR